MSRSKTVVTTISKIADRPVDHEAALVVICGHDLGRKYDLATSPLVIGRSAAADIQLERESVSRAHAQLVFAKGAVSIEDLGSTNGTLVNDKRISEARRLMHGDLIKVGSTILKFIEGGNIEASYHEEVYRLTTVDGLTQVANRRFFEEALEREVSRSRRYGRDVSLIMLDIDRFKDVNDRFGHLAGDQVLRSIAQLMRTSVRREDTLARYGGEEFALLLPEVGMAAALQVAEKLRQRVVAQTFVFGRRKLNVTVSLGVAALGQSTSDASSLLRSADEKLYAAKSAGRNQVSA
ncbi:MAG: diguanylate cyclase [Myxococcaceae bacterium]